MKGYRLSILRHGLTEANENGVYIGKTDLPLSEAGREALQDKYDFFEYPKVQRVYSSPLERAVQSAEILFPEREIVIVDDLREMDFGVFENIAAEERPDAHLFNVRFGGRDHLVELGNELLFLRLLNEIDDLVCVVERLSALFVGGDLVFDGGNFSSDFGGTLKVLPDLWLFLLRAEVLKLRIAVVDIERVLRLAQHFLEILEF